MPDWKIDVRRRLDAAALRPEREAEIVEELAQHLEDHYLQLMAGGESAAAARAATLAELERADVMALQLRRTEPPARAPAGFGLGGDLRYALRTFGRNPGFALFVVLTLALGIAANTAVFTIVNTLLLNPLPVREPARLVGIENSGGRSASGSRLPLIPYASLLDLRQQTRVFDGMAGYSSIGAVRIAQPGGSERLFTEFVTANYFDVLGLKPALGRFFAADADGRGAHPVTVLGYTAWQHRFGGAADILGRVLRVNGSEDVTVIGVAPEGFKGVTVVFGPDLWMPASEAETLLPGQRGLFTDRTMAAFHIAARLKPGVAAGQAEAAVRTIDAALKRQYPELSRDQSLNVIPLARAAQGDFSQPLVSGSLVLTAVTGLILLICCSNAASLFLARASGRRQEIALRLALGATRSRLIRQLLTECAALALAGGALGLALGWEGCLLLWSLRPADVALNFADPKLDGAVVAFAVFTSLVTALVFGLAPALQASRPQVIEAIKEEARTAGRTRSRANFRNLLLVAQVAFSLVALVAAALFLRGMQRAYSIDPGFQTAHLGIVLTNQGQAGYDRVRAESFYQEVRRRVSAMPGVASVSWSSNLPLWNGASRSIEMEGREEARRQDAVPVIVNTIDVDYFATAGVPVIAGRDFTRFDITAAPSAAIVNQAMADRYWPHQSAVGRRFRFFGEPQLRQVVGIARTADYSSLGEAPQPCVYLPLAQNFSANMILYVRTQGAPSSVLAAVQRALVGIDPKLDVSDARTGARLMDQALFAPRIVVGLLGVFGLLGLALASVGLYGIVAYTVSQRRREIGVRVALGASQAAVRAMVIRQGMTLVAAGLVLGAAVALLVGHAVSRMLYGVSAADPLSFLGAAAVLSAVAFVACYLPARRVSRLDPLAALRDS